jgi:hypothetical protein
VVDQAKACLVASVCIVSSFSWSCSGSGLTLIGWRHHAWVQ